MMNPLDQLSPTERFSTRAQDYAKYRPGYPKAVVQTLSDEAGLMPEAVIADVGSGTGLLSELFLDNGNTVLAIEPNTAMRSIAEQRLGSRANFRSIDGIAESTSLEHQSVDGVVCAQAFHWFNPEKAVREFARILRPGGFVSLIWNIRATDSSAFMHEYESLVRSYAADRIRNGRDDTPRELLDALFGSEMRLRCFDNYQDLDWPGFRGRLLSSSYAPLPGMDGFDKMLRELRRMFDEYQAGGQVRLQYETRLYFVRAKDLPKQWKS